MTDTCLITTTINVPTVLRQYRQSDPDVLFIIAGDLQSPHDDIKALCAELKNAIYLSPQDQDKLDYACSPVIGYRSIQRRNIALLEALRAGAQVVVSVDDDNAPRSSSYFEDLRKSLDTSVDFVVADEWFDLGYHAREAFVYRGFPFSLRETTPESECEASSGHVGIVNGYIYGDPDINAIDRYPGGGTRVERYGADSFLVNPRTTWTPINSQNTAYVRELAPLAFVLPGIGRYDDIWASYIAQRVMEATDYHVYFGEPSVVQERNPHNWLKDLENELYGMRHTEDFCQFLKAGIVDEGKSVIDNLAGVVRGCRYAPGSQLPGQSLDFLRCYIDDVARVL